MIINSSAKAHHLFQKRISPTVEEVWVAGLSSRLEVLDIQLLFRGTVDSCPIHPRDLIRFICITNASAWLIAHNHPSGDTRPSRQDNIVTRRLWKLSQLVEIPLHDHLILSGEKYFSYADHQFFQKKSPPIFSGLADSTDAAHRMTMATESAPEKSVARSAPPKPPPSRH